MPQSLTKYEEDNKALLLYRMEVMETSLRQLTEAIGRRDNIGKSDINELRDTIVTRIGEVSDNLQTQIDKLDKHKADKADVQSLSRIIWWGLGIIGSIATALIIAAFKIGH